MTRPSGQPQGATGEGANGDGVIDAGTASREASLSRGTEQPAALHSGQSSTFKVQRSNSDTLAAAAPGTDVAETDAALLGRIRAGESAAFAALYERHKGWVLAVAFRFCGDRELALDVLQETFAFLLRRAPTLTLDAKLTTYLFPAVRNLSQTARRKRARIGGGDLVEHRAPRGELDERRTPLGDDEELARVVAGLPDAQRELIYMRYVAGMMPTEIAVVLGVPVGTAKSRLFAAVRAVETGLRGKQ